MDRGAHTPAGESLVIGGPQVGSELSWAGVFVPRNKQEPTMSAGAALAVLRYVAFETNPSNYSLTELQFDRPTFDRLRAMHVLYDATDTDLKPFAARGGKLMLWHGWSDPHISPINTIAYFESVQKHLGRAEADKFVRLFLFPGMYHCLGGDGPAQFDVLTPLMSWVEKGSAPTQILAARPLGMPGPGPGPRMADGQRPGPPKNIPVDRTRPVYAYPQVATYRGSGSIDDASSFAPKQGATGPASYDWVGNSFMSPGFHRPCSTQNGKVRCAAN